MSVGTILKNAAGASQGIGPGYTPAGTVAPTLVALPLAILVELRVMNIILLGQVPLNADLNVMRAEELNNATPPGSL